MPTNAGITVTWLAPQFPALTALQPLSHGGQKLVFSAVHAVHGAVVLKLMDPQQSEERTSREPFAAERLRASRVPKIFEQGEVQTTIGSCRWFLEQRIDGATLREALCVGPFRRDKTLRLGYQILETLTAAEQVRIVHRDVKPDNIICDHAGNNWLIDFGFARHLELTSLTASALPFGHMTWGYAPPEQCRNLKQDIDARADLHALGVTLYECATGTHPFRDGARDALEILSRVEKLRLPRLVTGPSFPDEFADLVETLTHKRRDHRPPTARDAFEWMAEICDRDGLLPDLVG